MREWIENIYGLSGATLIILVIISSVLRLAVRPITVRRIVLSLAFALSISPISGISLVELLRGVMGDIAIPTWLLCVLALSKCWSSGCKSNDQASQKFRPLSFLAGDSLIGFFVVVSVVGCVFYPMTMGFTLIDPYAWGYSPRWMLLSCLLVTVAFEFAGQRTAASWVLLSVGAYAMRLMESTNLWDYLLDPILFLVGLVGCTAELVGRLRFETHPPRSSHNESIVRSFHSCLDQPATIEEVRRILHEHLNELPSDITPTSFHSQSKTK